jgi:hypothetical protein
VDAVWPALLGACGLVIVGLMTYLATRKQTETTDEIALREEGRAMRDELREAYKDVKAELEAVRLRLDTSEKVIAKQDLEIVSLRSEIAMLKATRREWYEEDDKK